MKEIKISTESIKLDQFLKYAGLVQSGGQARVLIEDGQVLVNGELVLTRSSKLTEGDLVEVKDLDSFLVI